MQAQRHSILTLLILASSLAAGQTADTPYHALKAGGSTYFTTKIENLTQKLQLSPDQQTKIKPVAEQEVGYLEEIRANPVLSKREKLKKLELIVRNSDTQMKTVLSSEQWQKLQSLRKQQKQQLKEFATHNGPVSHSAR